MESTSMEVNIVDSTGNLNPELSERELKDDINISLDQTKMNAREPTEENDYTVLISRCNELAESATETNNVKTIIQEVDDIANKIVVGEDDIEVVFDDSYQTNVLEIEYDFNHVPQQITGSWKEFDSNSKNNFTRGCIWYL